MDQPVVRRRLRRIVLLVALLLPVVITGAGIAIWYGVGGTDPVARGFLRWISTREGSRWVVQSSRVKGNLLRSVAIDSVRVAWRDKTGREIDLLTADRMIVRWRPRAVVRSRLELRRVEFHHAVIWLARLPALREEATGGPRSAPPLHPLLSSLVLENSELVMREGAPALSIRGVRGEIRGEVTGTDWHLDLTGGEIHSGDARLPLIRCSVHAKAGVRAVAFSELHVAVGSSRLDGKADLTLNPAVIHRASLTAAPLSFLDVAILSGGAVPPHPGEVSGLLNLSEAGGAHLVEGSLTGLVDSVRFGVRSLAVRVRGKEVTVDSLAGDIAGGPIALRGTVSLAEPREHNGQLTFTELPLAPLFRAGGKPVPGSLTGSLDWKGHGFGSAEREIEAELHLARGRVSAVTIPPLDVTATSHPGGQLEANLVGSGGLDRVEGHVSRTASGDLTGTIGLALSRSSNRGLLAMLTGLEDFTAEGRLDGTLSGTRSEQRVEFHGDLSDIRMGATTAEVASLAATWDTSRPAAPLIATLDAAGIRRGSALVQHAGLDLEGGLTAAAVRRFQLEAKNLNLTAAGQVERGKTGTLVRIDTLQAISGELAWTLRTPARLSLGTGMTRLEGLELAADGAELSASGTIDKGHITASAQLHGLELKQLGEVSFLGGPAAGVVSIEASFNGTAADPRGQGTAKLTNGVIHGLPIVDATLDVVLENHRLTIRRGFLEGSGGMIDISGWMPVRHEELTGGELHLSTRDLRLSALRPLSSVLAKTDGRIDLDAVWLNPRGRPDVTFTSTVRNLTVGDHEVGDLTAKGRLSRSVLDLSDVVITGGVNDGTVHLTGRFPLIGGTSPDSARVIVGPPENYLLTADIEKGDLAFLTFLTKDVSEASGAFSGHFVVTGTLSTRNLSGNLVVSDGTVTIPKLMETIREVNGAAVIDSNRFTISRAEARQGSEGRVTLTGTATLTGNRLGVYDLNLRTRRYEPHLWHDISGLLDCDFLMTPDTLASGRVVPHLSGEVNAEELVVKRELPEAPAGGGGLALPPPEVTFELRLWAHRNVWLQTREARLELQGEVFTAYDETGLSMLGEVETIRGYYWLYNHRFEVRRGVFTFNDIEDVGNVGLDVLADTNVRGEKIEVTMAGTLRKPVIETSSESGWDETTIFRTLTLGAPGPDEGGEGSFTSGFVQAWRGALLERLGARVAEDIGIDEIRLHTDGEEGEGTRFEIGKRWADVYLNFRTAIGQETTSGPRPAWELRDPERAISVEYRMSDLFSLDGEAGTLEGTDYVNVDLKYKLDY